MSLVRDEVTMMTSSDIVERHLMPRYTIRRRMVSLLWKSLVMAKKHSVASVVPMVSPWLMR